MKKKVLLILVMLLGSRPASGQVLIALLFGDKLNTGKIEFGLDGGLNLASMGGVDQSGYLKAFNLGFYFDIKLANPSWMIHTGVLVVSTMGADGVPVYSLDDPELDAEFDGGSVTRKLSYFNVPIMIKYRSAHRFHAEGGIQLGLMYGAEDVFMNTGGDLTYTTKIKDQYHPLDAGAVVGVGYRLLGANGITLSMRYYFGFIDVLIDDAVPAQYNRSIYFTAGIPIGASKSPKEDNR
jgi:hypothetical protein